MVVERELEDTTRKEITQGFNLESFRDTAKRIKFLYWLNSSSVNE